MDTTTHISHHKRMRLRAIRLQIELCAGELEQLILEEPTGPIRNAMTEINISIHSAREMCFVVGAQIV